MWEVTLSILIAFVIPSHAKAPVAKLTNEKKGSTDMLADKVVRDFLGRLVDKTVDNLVEDLSRRTLNVSFVHHADLDRMTLGKPGCHAMPSGSRVAHCVPSISRGVANAPSLRVRAASPSKERSSQRPVPDSSLPSTRRQILGGLMAATVPVALLTPNPAKASLGTASLLPTSARTSRKKMSFSKQQLDKEADSIMDMKQQLVQIEKEMKLRQQDYVLKKDLRNFETLLKDALFEFEHKKRMAKHASTLAALEAQPDWFNYAAAFVASSISTLLMHPMDTLKTREVTRAAGVTRDNEPSTTPVVAGIITGSSAIDELAKNRIHNDEMQVGSTDGTPVKLSLPQDTQITRNFSLAGYLSLYQGIQAALLKEGPPSALYLGVYEAVKFKLLALRSFASNPLLAYLIAGGIGESVGSVVRAPAEAIKSRMQSGMDPSTSESFRRVLFDREGRANVLRAWSASLWRDVPFGAVQLAIFEGLRSFLMNNPQSFLDIDVNTLTAEVTLGAIGGAIGSFLTVPMDVVTTRILTQKCDDESYKEALGFVGMSKKVWAEGGWRALLTGWKERTGYWAPAIGIFLSCYCLIRETAVEQHLFQ